MSNDCEGSCKTCLRGQGICQLPKTHFLDFFPLDFSDWNVFIFVIFAWSCVLHFTKSFSDAFGDAMTSFPAEPETDTNLESWLVQVNTPACGLVGSPVCIARITYQNTHEWWTARPFDLYQYPCFDRGLSQLLLGDLLPIHRTTNNNTFDFPKSWFWKMRLSNEKIQENIKSNEFEKLHTNEQITPARGPKQCVGASRGWECKRRKTKHLLKIHVSGRFAKPMSPGPCQDLCPRALYKAFVQDPCRRACFRASHMSRVCGASTPMSVDPLQDLPLSGSMSLCAVKNVWTLLGSAMVLLIG